jgi:all-trans-8'-apo-beta-carotenal 15,15'-oxygenase
VTGTQQVTLTTAAGLSVGSNWAIFGPSNGYDTALWSFDSTGSTSTGDTQTFTLTEPGQYYMTVLMAAGAGYSGDMFNFGVEFIPNPHLRVYRTDRQGKLKHYRSLSLPYVAMVHDFAITERYLVFLVSPIIPDGISIALGLKSFGDGMKYHPERGSSFVLIPRDGGKIRRIEYDAVLQFHLSNAFDDRGDVVLDVITYHGGELLECIARFRTSPLTQATSEFTRFRITGCDKVIRDQLSDRSCEFPRHHPDREGRPHRYSYFNTRHQLETMFDEITKLDLAGNTETSYAAQTPGNSFCEPVFAPRPGANDEDDGWLLSVEYQADTHTSRLIVLDARDLAGGPVATAPLAHHVPQGFHGSFVSR